MAKKTKASRLMGHPDRRTEAERLWQDKRACRQIAEDALKIEAAITLLRTADESLQGAREDISHVASHLRSLSKPQKPGLPPQKGPGKVSAGPKHMARRFTRRAYKDSQ